MERIGKTINDQGDFGEWVAPHVQAMANLAARLTGPSERDDVVQEALTRAWRKRSQFDPAFLERHASILRTMDHGYVGFQLRKGAARNDRLVEILLLVAHGRRVIDVEQQVDLVDALIRNRYREARRRVRPCASTRRTAARRLDRATRGPRRGPRRGATLTTLPGASCRTGLGSA